jgi:hypothetical protein
VTQATSILADRTEGELLDRLTGHPALQSLDSWPPERFLAMLLQRRFVSLIFTPMYDIAIDALRDPPAIRLVRQILREEYPGRFGRQPSHREDLVHDLLVLGATTDQVLACRPTPTTSSILTDTLHLMSDAAHDASDLRILTIVRFWGEVVVSVEYGEYWKRMAAQFDAAGVRSRFYFTHYSHDGRESLVTASTRSRTHSGRLGARVKQLLAASGTGDEFADLEAQVLELRLRFYDQFL